MASLALLQVSQVALKKKITVVLPHSLSFFFFFKVAYSANRHSTNITALCCTVIHYITTDSKVLS